MDQEEVENLAEIYRNNIIVYNLSEALINGIALGTFTLEEIENAVKITKVLLKRERQSQKGGQ